MKSKASRTIDFYEAYHEGFLKKHVTVCIISAFLYFVLPDVVSRIIIGTPFLLKWYIGTSYTFKYVFSIAVQDAIVFILILAVFGRYLLHSLKSYFGGRIIDAIYEAGRLILIYVITRCITFAISPIIYYFTQNQNANQESINTVTERLPILMFIVAVAIGPLIEEIIFRWGVFRTLYKVNPVLAYIISSGLFAFVHVSQAIFSGNLYELANLPLYFTVGFSLAFIYKKANNFMAPLFLHMLNNAISMTIIILGY